MHCKKYSKILTSELSGIKKIMNILWALTSSLKLQYFFLMSKILTGKLQNKRTITPCIFKHFLRCNFYSTRQHDRFQCVCVIVPLPTELDNTIKKMGLVIFVLKKKKNGCSEKPLNKIFNSTSIACITGANQTYLTGINIWRLIINTIVPRHCLIMCSYNV